MRVYKANLILFVIGGYKHLSQEEVLNECTKLVRPPILVG